MSVAINSVELGSSIEWIKKGWQLFTKAWLKLIIGVIVFYIGIFLIGLIPILGQLFLIVAAPCGMVAANIALKDIDSTGDFNWSSVFERLKQKLTPTLIISAVNFGLVVAMMIVSVVLIGGGLAAGGAMGSEAGMAAAAGIGGLVTFGFGLAIGIANWFSIPLIALSDISALDALKASLMASIKNILPMIVFGLIMMVLFFASMLTLGLGLLVVIPLSIGANYAATRALFPVAA
jgi:hypothetical protein